MKSRQLLGAVALATALGWTGAAQAHCDTLDGPVVAAARDALERGNVNRVLIWVQPQDAPELKAAFDKARAARAQGGAAQDVGSRWFYETVVRLHRSGEGAPYSGLKAAGSIEPAVAAADRALASGRVDDIEGLIATQVRDGLRTSYGEAASRRAFKPDDVDGGRRYVAAYVAYVHQVERLHEAAAPGGHQEAANEGTPAPAHPHGH